MVSRDDTPLVEVVRETNRADMRLQAAMRSLFFDCSCALAPTAPGWSSFRVAVSRAFTRARGIPPGRYRACSRTADRPETSADGSGDEMSGQAPVAAEHVAE
jgi:hypothetical protein